MQKLTVHIVLLLCWIFNTALVSETTRHRSYRITRNNKEIGKLQVLQQIRSENVYISLHARIHAQMLIPLSIVTRDEAMFKNGVMAQSVVFRQVNEKVTVNRKTTLQGKNYELLDGEKSKQLNRYPIAINMMLLYMNEPIGIKQVYSDHYQQFVQVIKTNLHAYKVTLPEGAINIYEYKDNVCYRIQVFNKLYEAVFELENNN